MRDCPQCSKPVDGLSCGFCGWGETSSTKRDDQRVPVKFGATVIQVPRCAGIDVDASGPHRCGEPGTISNHGNGPGYCWRHAKPMLDNKGTAPPGGFGNLKKMLAPKRLDVEAQLERAAIQGKE